MMAMSLAKKVWLGGVLVVAGCGSQVRASDEASGGSGGETTIDDILDCGPKPPAEGWCPPIWQCQDGEWVNAGGACPAPICPADVPPSGSDCEMLGQSCMYEGAWFDCGGDSGSIEAVCTDQGWTQVTHYCQPVPECPETLPIDGADCSDWLEAYFCDYAFESECGPASAYAECVYSGAEDVPRWEVEIQGEVCGACDAHADPATCAQNAACQWVVPGCGEPTLAEAGCYPLEPCQPGQCEGDTECVEVWRDPCWDSACNACGEPISLCVTDVVAPPAP